MRDNRPFDKINGYLHASAEYEGDPKDISNRVVVSVHYEWEGGDAIGITDAFLEDMDPRFVKRDGDIVTFGDQYTVRLTEHYDNGIWLAERVL